MSPTRFKTSNRVSIPSGVSEIRKRINDHVDDTNYNTLGMRQVESIAEQSLNDAGTAKTSAFQAEVISKAAELLAQSVQEQFNGVVLEGAVDPETAQARVNKRGRSFSTLKGRADDLDTEFEERGANIKWFKQIPDADDTASLQRAMDSGNGIVEVPDGDFVFKGKITYRDGTILRGKGVKTSVKFNGTTEGLLQLFNAKDLQLRNMLFNCEENSNILIKAVNCENVKIIGIGLKGNKKVGTAIHLENCKNSEVFSNIISGTSHNRGISITNCIDTYVGPNVFHDCGRAGIGVRYGNKNVHIFQNIVDGCMREFELGGDGAIDVYGPNNEGVYIYRNEVMNTGSEETGDIVDIRVMGTKDGSVEYNTIHDSPFTRNLITISQRVNENGSSTFANIRQGHNIIHMNHTHEWLLRISSTVDGAEDVDFSDNVIKGEGRTTGFLISVRRPVLRMRLEKNNIRLPNQESNVIMLQQDSGFHHRFYQINDNTIHTKGRALFGTATRYMQIKGNTFYAEADIEILTLTGDVNHSMVKDNFFMGVNPRATVAGTVNGKTGEAWKDDNAFIAMPA